MLKESHSKGNIMHASQEEREQEESIILSIEAI